MVSRTLRTARLLALPALLAVVLAVAEPAAVAALPVEDARERAGQLRGQLDEVVERYERTLVDAELAEDELVGLERREAELAGLADDLTSRLGQRARDVFKHGSTTAFDTLLSADQPTEAVERASLFVTVQQRDRVELEDALAVRAALDQTRALVRDQRDRLAGLEGELAGVRAELEQRLDDAELIVASLEEMAQRQREVNTAMQQGTYACPMGPGVTHFIDSFGHPRSGGRSHRGTDVMGPMGAPVFAFTSGVIERHHNSRLGGISLYLRADDGATYFYTHLQGYAPRGAAGTRVHAGEHIAYNGNTGNARGGAPHIHFERHPGGGAAVNPYPWLTAVCF